MSNKLAKIYGPLAENIRVSIITNLGLGNVQNWARVTYKLGLGSLQSKD